MQSGAIRVDDAHGCVPLVDTRVILPSPKEDQSVPHNRPRRLEIPVPSCDRFSLSLPEDIDRYLTVFVVR